MLTTSVRLQDLAFIVLGIGALSSILFHVGTKEKTSGASVEVEREDGRGNKRTGDEEGEFGEHRPLLPRPSSSLLQWKCWLQQPSFYQVGAFITSLLHLM